MNENKKSTMMYEGIPVIAELNKVAGFNPLAFLRKVNTNEGERSYLDLKYKKLWFRLKCPQGRIKVAPLKITEQIAIIEAKVFLDKGDTTPTASFIAQRNAKETPGGLYIESAQHAAIDQALVDAGFGMQFSDVNGQQDKELYDNGIKASVPKTQSTVQAVTINKPVTTQQITPVIAEVVQATPVVADVVETAPVIEEVVQTAPVVAEVVQTAPVVAEVVQTAPVVEEVVQTAPVVTEVVQAAPVVSEVVQATPVVTEVVQTAPVVAEMEQTAPVVAEVTLQPSEEIIESDNANCAYTSEMDVDAICVLMTLEEANEIIVDTGSCKGWTLSQVAQRRAVSLKWLLTAYAGDNNILRAGAKIVLENMSA